MASSWRKMFVTSAAVAALALPATLAGAPTASAAVTNGGNASGGPLEAQAAKLPLVGPKGTGLTRGVTSNSITVGCEYTAADYSGYPAGLAARFARVNKSGGIYGRKINLLPCKDDGNVVQTNVQDVQQIVNQNHAFAVMNLSANLLAGSTNFLNANQVPYFDWGILPGLCGTRWGFGWSGCLTQSLLPPSNPFYHVVQGNLADAVIAASGKKPSQIRVAFQAQNNESGIFGNKLYVPLWKSLGAKVVYAQANAPATGTFDYTPYVQAIMAKKPNIVVLSTIFSLIGGFASALKAAGYHGMIQDFVTYSPGLLQSSPQLAASLQGEYINNQTVPQEEKSPFVKLEQSDLKAIGRKPNLTLGASIGWAEAEQFIEMVKAAGKNLNTKTFDQAVNGGKFESYTNLPAGGLGKLKWPAAHFLAADCSAVLRVKGTAYEVAVPFRCYSSVNTAAPAAKQTAARSGTTVSAVKNATLGTTLLVGPNGRTLYLFEKDSRNKSDCSGSCAVVWPPLTTSAKPRAGAGVTASMLGTTARSGGKTQITYNGHPLYYYSGDTGTGKVSGQGINHFGGLWYAVSPQGKAITTTSKPSGATKGNGGY